MRKTHFNIPTFYHSVVIKTKQEYLSHDGLLQEIKTKQMNIYNIIRTLYKQGDYAHKRKVYDSLDTDVAFERFTKRILTEDKTFVKEPRRMNLVLARQKPLHKYIAIAASFLIPIILTTAILSFPKDNTDGTIISNALPGTSTAYIETSNGEVIALDSASISINRNGIKASAADGELVIESADKIGTTSIYIPRGGEYKLTLLDGTKVHLNSDSKLTFPSRFTGDSRNVELTGEAYFEVAHDDNKPFIVHLGNVSVKQYGTSFNINAYTGKSKTITLIEGSIGVTAGNNECRLTPGRQAYINGDEMRVCNADIDAVMGWTEGVFNFDGENLEEIATTLSRWYNVDICVDASLSNCNFTGSLSRDSSLRDILEAICEITNTTICVNGNTVKIKK